MTSSKPHSKQGLFRRDLAAQGRGGWPKDADPTASGPQGPACPFGRSEQSTGHWAPSHFCAARAPQ